VTAPSAICNLQSAICNLQSAICNRRRTQSAICNLQSAIDEGRNLQSAILVLGYGNPLRGDDAVGPQIAQAVALWALPGVRTLALHQLTPELAAVLAEVRYVLFVDGYRTDATAATVELRVIAPHNQAQLAAHTGDPRALLALTNAVYGHSPRAWLLTVPATSFDYGADLSHVARAGVASTLPLIRDLIRTMTEVTR
jgi:hydrogenase maturation protease